MTVLFWILAPVAIAAAIAAIALFVDLAMYELSVRREKKAEEQARRATYNGRHYLENLNLDTVALPVADVQAALSEVAA